MVYWIDYQHRVYISAKSSQQLWSSEQKDKSVARPTKYIFSQMYGSYTRSGSAINDDWNMLSSKIKSECGMLKKDSQTIFLMQIIGLRILWACVWISVCMTVWSFGYKELSIIPHAIKRNYDARLLNFSSAWYVNNFRPTIPSLSQQDTSVKASDRRKWIFFLNKQTWGEAS